MAIKSITTLVTTCPACGERAYDDGVLRSSLIPQPREFQFRS